MSSFDDQEWLSNHEWFFNDFPTLEDLVKTVEERKTPCSLFRKPERLLAFMCVLILAEEPQPAVKIFVESQGTDYNDWLFRRMLQEELIAKISVRPEHPGYAIITQMMAKRQAVIQRGGGSNSARVFNVTFGDRSRIILYDSRSLPNLLVANDDNSRIVLYDSRSWSTLIHTKAPPAIYFLQYKSGNEPTREAVESQGIPAHYTYAADNQTRTFEYQAHLTERGVPFKTFTAYNDGWDEAAIRRFIFPTKVIPKHLVDREPNGGWCYRTQRIEYSHFVPSK